jgi:methyl-accepting chemotaxis protein
MNFTNLRISTRLWTGFGAIAALMALVVAIGVVKMNSIEAGVDNVVRASRNELLAVRILDGVNSMRRYQLNALAIGAEERVKEMARVTARGKEVLQQAEELEKAQRNPETKKLAGSMRELAEKYARGHEQVARLAQEGKFDAMKELVQGEERKVQRAVVDEVEKFAKIQADRKAKAEELTEQEQKAALTLMLSLLAAALVLAAVVAALIARSIAGPVAEAVRVAEALAKGDLSQNVEARSRDEIGQLMLALKGTVAQLSGIVGRIKETSDMVGSASREIAQGNTDLSSRTEEQASALEETSASMQQMTATVGQNAQNAQKVNELAAQASGVAAKGGEVVKEAVGTMNGITASSKKIADIIGVIDGIAFQTNILALNAAVEAARAGEQGRGFAVVASEVRSLAQRSAAAAKEIKDLITDSVSKVDAGSRQVNDAGRTMEEIVSSVKKVTTLIAEITAASQEQAQGIEQVSETMTQMEKVTQQNAAMVEEASAAASSLEEQSRTLASAVAEFKLGEVAHSAPAAAPVERAASNVVALPKRAAFEASKVQPKLRAAATRAASAVEGKSVQEEGWREF